MPELSGPETFLVFFAASFVGAALPGLLVLAAYGVEQLARRRG